jgi:hypothetical protein
VRTLTSATSLLALLACAHSVPRTSAPAASPPSTLEVGVAGTYQIRVCMRSCAEGDTAGVMVEGLLVLRADTIALSEFPPERRRHLSLTRFGMLGPPNGCFALRRRRDVPTLAGIEATALTHWSVGPDSVVRVELYRSPDARYETTVRWRPGANGATLRGEGRSRTAWVAEAHWPREEIIGERVGPPDVRVCAVAVQ